MPKKCMTCKYGVVNVSADAYKTYKGCPIGCSKSGNITVSERFGESCKWEPREETDKINEEEDRV